jgi:ERCC4-type nuclease
MRCTTLPRLKPGQITVVVDTREQKRWDVAPMQSVTATLDTGDYSVRGLEHVVRVERKSLPDLLACVGRDRQRFDREIRRLLGYQVRALIVESTWQEIETGAWRSKVSPDAVIGSLLGWIVLGLPVVMAGNHQRAGRYASKLLFTVARRRWKELRTLAANVAE